MIMYGVCGVMEILKTFCFSDYVNFVRKNV